MKWKEFLADYFTFSRKERIGLLAVILLIVGIWIFPKVSRPSRPERLSADTSWITAAKMLFKFKSGDSDTEQKIADGNAYAVTTDRRISDGSSNQRKAQLFTFDPNALTFEGWQKLGIREKTIAMILSYLRKGGHFYRAEDLKKIYGIQPDEYKRLEPYVRILAGSPGLAGHTKMESINETFVSKKAYAVVDVNTADTTAFVALPGIGSKLALRIVNFRDKLGGFYSVDQIAEIYGLPDSSFQRIKHLLKLDNPSIKKININTASKDEMKLHPYFKWNLANAIVEYRNQHGNFSSLDDLKNISLITADVFDKIKFYVAL